MTRTTLAEFGEAERERMLCAISVRLHVQRRAPLRNAKGYSSTYLALGFAYVRTGTRYPPEH